MLCGMIPSKTIRLAYVCFLLLKSMSLVTSDCSRAASRIVRNIFKQKIEVIFKEHGLLASTACPFNVENDIFGIQEFYASESTNKWTCHLCGKSFFDGHFLDRHLDLKHIHQLLKGENVRCLAEFCDWMRCDVVGGRVVSEFWDFALCMQSTMSVLRNRCMDTLELCVPKEANATLHAHFLVRMNLSLCAYLTCDSYWDQNPNNDQLSSVKVVLVTLFTVFLLVALLGYYYVAFTYFLTYSFDADKMEPFEEGHVTYSVQNSLRHRQTAM